MVGLRFGESVSTVAIASTAVAARAAQSESSMSRVKAVFLGEAFKPKPDPRGVILRLAEKGLGPSRAERDEI
jgi:hypothetical protein